MELSQVLANVLLATSGLAVFFWMLYRVVRWAWQRASGAYILGALIIPIGGMGNVSDPDYKVVDQAKQIKQKAEDDTGDPPSE